MCPSVSMDVLILTCRSRLLLSSCAALFLCILLVCAAQSNSRWDSTDLPLCEAYRRQDSWASPGSSCSSTQWDREDVEGLLPQETHPQQLNGHGTSSLDKAWGVIWSAFLHFINKFLTNILLCCSICVNHMNSFVLCLNVSYRKSIIRKLYQPESLLAPEKWS